ncbi:hypothetical protein OC842_002761 [Tilletia horrida]|uniref:Uncharacterized protein n=1 Tax=Tilletia horrida TaxID=155126 RepID=A0AAN6GET1_9BASI|nr:hypothetical protein OC842_002761 [Tilletia horrida]
MVTTQEFSASLEAELRAQALDVFEARLDVGQLDDLAARAKQASQDGVMTSEGNTAIADAHHSAATGTTHEWTPFLVSLRREGRAQLGLQNEDATMIWRTNLRAITFFDQKRKDSLHAYAFPAFKRRFDIYTNNIFAHLNWNNVLVAGGSVLACATSDLQDSNNFAGTDIDVFMYGLTAKESMAKVAHLRNAIDQAVNGFERAYRTTITSGVITFTPRREPALRTVQIILRLHRDPLQVLANFDLDQCAVGYTGADVWLEPRAVRAIKTGYTVLTMQLAMQTSIRRLFKYAMRGYGCALLAQDGEVIGVSSLAQAFSQKFDSVGHRLTLLRDPGEDHIPPHRSVRAKDVVGWAREQAKVPFLDGFGPFCWLAALWEHDCTWARERHALTSQIGFFEDLESTTNPLGYETRELPVFDNRDCEAAIRLATDAGDGFSLLDAGVRYEKVKQAALANILNDDFTVVVVPQYLPLELAQFLDKLSSSTAGSDMLVKIAGAPALKDTEEIEYELYAWTRQGPGHWQPGSGIDAIVFAFLRGAAGATVWALSRLYLGAEWPTLEYGRVLRAVTKRMRVYREPLVNAAQMQAWLAI